jgi:intracellular sulfur oxidation DsrE/DsrF family protein
MMRGDRAGAVAFSFRHRETQQVKRIAAAFVVLLAGLLVWGTALAQDKVVYHIDNAEAQATKALRNIRNHLDVAPNTKIVVVTHAEGVDFLMEGAKDKKNPNIEYASLVSALKARGVRFEVCELTLRNRELKKDQFIMDADFTPSGVVRIAQLQQREGYAYIKP